jgi:hypothetical protein
MKFPGLMHKGIDEKNGYTLWGDATILELNQIDEYVTFIDEGHHSKVSASRI